MSLDTQDKNYIETQFNVNFERAHKRFTEDMERHTGILKEHFEHKLDMVIELVKDKPGREEFGELKDEISDMHREMRVFQVNLKDHERRIGRLEVACR